jgi:hypothetical protein
LRQNLAAAQPAQSQAQGKAEAGLKAAWAPSEEFYPEK